MGLSSAWRDYTIECEVSGDGISLPPSASSFEEGAEGPVLNLKDANVAKDSL